MIGHECDGPVEVIIHRDGKEDVGIPVLDISVHERKDGPTSITRRAEVDFPLSGLGDEWVSYIGAFNPTAGLDLPNEILGEEINNPPRMQRASVRMKPQQIGDELDIDLPPNILGEDVPDSLTNFKRTVITGYIGAVGANGANTGHLTIFGPYNLLSSIPVGVTLDLRSMESGLEWITNKLNETQPMFDDIGWRNIGPIKDPDTGGTMGKKSFGNNRDTLADIFKWIIETTGHDLWFEPRAGGTVDLVAQWTTFTELPDRFELQDFVKEAMQIGKDRDASSDGPLQIIQNNALYEMKPYNAVTVKGKATKEVPAPGVAPGTVTVPSPEGSYPESTAVYPPLVERAGGEIEQVVNSEKDDESEIETTARKKLKQGLDDVSGGSITFPLSPFIRPYDFIYAQPGCNDNIESSLPVLRYEVEKVIHRVSPNNRDDGKWIPRSEASVSMSVDPELIESTTTRKSAQPAEGTENDPDEGLGPEDFLVMTTI